MFVVVFTQLAALTPRPIPGLDSISSAIPMVAPFSALSDFAYRVKLLPGGGKKGAVVRDCIQLFKAAVHAAAGTRDAATAGAGKKAKARAAAAAAAALGGTKGKGRYATGAGAGAGDGDANDDSEDDQNEENEEEAVSPEAVAQGFVRQSELLQQMNENEFIAALLPNCKVMAPGIAAMHSKVKKDKKKQAQQQAKK